MAKFKIQWLVRKSPDWIVAELIDEGGTNLKEVSINKTSKKGEPFPLFEEMQPGREIEGELWTSDKGKNYLFPPRVAKTGNGGAFKQKMIEDTMQKKNDSISHFQDNKEQSIKLASAQRDAVLIVKELLAQNQFPYTETGVKEEIIKWRNWFLSDEFTKGITPF